MVALTVKMATTVYEREIGIGGVGVRICIKGSNGGYQVTRLS